MRKRLKQHSVLWSVSHFKVNLLLRIVDDRDVVFVCGVWGEKMSKDKTNKTDVVKEINFNGSALVDQQGREIAIADEMIESVFEHVKTSIIKSHEYH